MLQAVETSGESELNPAQCLISLDQVRFRWTSDGEDVLHIPSMQIDRSERVFIQGASGSGKTTLLSLLGGVITPQQGRISVLDCCIDDMPPSKRDSFRADHIGFIFQMFNLIPYLTLVDNVTLPCRFSKLREKNALSRSGSLRGEAERLLNHLGLDVERLSSRSVTELSVGQQQRVAAARALIGSPEVIIADEPTSALDADARFAFIDLLFHEVELSGSTLVFVSHDAALRSHFDRTIVLKDVNLAHQNCSA